ncbi:hypothetical protein [Hyalangium versicolor]|uniref:hypothetical protein n=1 Tax=Hyalangium versicolor TaxID=2861190 RepID=UPI001CCAD3A2|nr:hypothetical protein [Hyalangium versicolor]
MSQLLFAVDPGRLMWDSPYSLGLIPREGGGSRIGACVPEGSGVEKRPLESARSPRSRGPDWRLEP